MPLQGGLTIERMCQLAQVSRAGFYRWLQEPQPVEGEMEVRSAIQQIAMEHRRRYGYRRISAELRRRGMPVNHKRVARIMQEDNLLAVQPRQFVATTKSDHKLEVYLNLARRMKLTGIDQLWVADITYMVQSLHYDFVEDGQHDHPFFHVQLTDELIPQEDLQNAGFGLSVAVSGNECWVTTRIPTPDMTLASVIYCLMADHLGASGFSEFAENVESIQNRIPAPSFEPIKKSLDASAAHFKSSHWFSHMDEL